MQLKPPLHFHYAAIAIASTEEKKSQTRSMDPCALGPSICLERPPKQALVAACWLHASTLSEERHHLLTHGMSPESDTTYPLLDIGSRFDLSAFQKS